MRYFENRTDKLDYLNRDARYCGVPYGAQDVDFILSRLWPDPKQGLLIDARAIPSVESVLFSKYLMYPAVTGIAVQIIKFIRVKRPGKQLPVKAQLLVAGCG